MTTTRTTTTTTATAPQTTVARAAAILDEREADLTEGERERIAARLADAPLSTLAAAASLYTVR